MSSLYQLAVEFVEFDRWLSEEGQDAQPEEVAAKLAALDGAAALKLESCGRLVRNLEAEDWALVAEAERLYARSVVAKTKAQRIQAAIKVMMEAAKTPKLHSFSFTFTIQQNGGAQGVEFDDVDPADVDPALTYTTTSINREAVRQALEAGGTVPFARLKTRGTHLRIK